MTSRSGEYSPADPLASPATPPTEKPCHKDRMQSWEVFYNVRAELLEYLRSAEKLDEDPDWPFEPTSGYFGYGQVSVKRFARAILSLSPVGFDLAKRIYLDMLAAYGHACQINEVPNVKPHANFPVFIEGDLDEIRISESAAKLSKIPAHGEEILFATGDQEPAELIPRIPPSLQPRIVMNQSRPRIAIKADVLRAWWGSEIRTIQITGTRRLLRVRRRGATRSEKPLKYGLVVLESRPTIIRAPHQGPMPHSAENTRVRIAIPGLEQTDIAVYVEPPGNRRPKKTQVSAGSEAARAAAPALPPAASPDRMSFVVSRPGSPDAAAEQS